MLAIGRESHGGAELAATAPRAITPDHLEIFQAHRGRGIRDHQLGLGQRQARSVVTGDVARLAIGQIDALVVGEVGRDIDTQHAALTAILRRRHVQNRALEALLADQPDGADLFGDQHAAIRQEGDTPGQVECRDRGHVEGQVRYRRLRTRIHLCAGLRRAQSHNQSRIYKSLHVPRPLLFSYPKPLAWSCASPACPTYDRSRTGGYRPAMAPPRWPSHPTLCGEIRREIRPAATSSSSAAKPAKRLADETRCRIKNLSGAEEHKDGKHNRARPAVRNIIGGTLRRDTTSPCTDIKQFMLHTDFNPKPLLILLDGIGVLQSMPADCSAGTGANARG